MRTGCKHSKRWDDSLAHNGAPSPPYKWSINKHLLITNDVKTSIYEPIPVCLTKISKRIILTSRIQKLFKIGVPLRYKGLCDDCRVVWNYRYLFINLL